MDDATAIRAAGSNIAMVMAESSTAPRSTYRAESLDSVQIRGVTKEYNDIPSTQIEQRPPDHLWRV